jgi:hypothetical protein
MIPFRLSPLKSLLGRSRARRRPAATFPRPRLELLEDRVVPSSDPYTLYTYGDAYTGAMGQDQKSFPAFYQPFDEALGGSSVLPLVQSTPSVSDPGSPGPFAVTTQEYNLGDLAFRPTHSAWATSGTELTGEIKAPTDLGNTAHPVIVLLHGRHATTYDPVTGTPFLEWPATGNHLPIPSYRGYDYLGDVLASRGYVVVSIGADGINARDNNEVFPDLGMTARAELMQRTFGILQDLNTDGVIRPRPADATHPGTDLFTGASSPFGTRFVGKLDLQNIGIMGHSRGGEGVVRSYILNQSLGSPYGIKAVFALAPVDFIGSTINNVPFAVLLPYNDGDVSNLQGAHFFDDSRYVSGDTGPKFSIEVMGANHNFYNTVWSPGLFPFPGAPDRFGGTLDEGVPAPPSRLTEAQQQGTGLAYMSAFFRTYLGGETRFLPILTGDVAPPPSAQVAPDRIHIGYLPPDSAAVRRDVNRLLTTANLTTNTLGGAVLTGGLTTYTIGGPVSGEANGGNQLSLGYSSTLTAFYENDLPAGARDERFYNDLQFRIGVNLGDPRNPLNTNQDFSVMLIDGGGHSYSTLVSAWSDALFYPPQSLIPHEVLNTVRIPLRAFSGFIDLSNVTAIRFGFDQHNSGAFQIADLAFADLGAAGPYVVDSAPSGKLLGPQSSVRVQFDRPIKAETFTINSIDSFTRTAGATVTDLLSAITGVTPVGSDGRQFDITFASQGLAGFYQLTIGPNIQDEAGNPMDQNHNILAGEDADTYTATFAILGPKIIAGTPTGNANVPDPTRKVRVTFNEPVNPATFTANQVLASGPQGVIVVSAVAPVSDSNNTQFDITFPQIVTGEYTVVIGPDIQDFAGNKMDQNDNFVGGEQPGDLYVQQFGVQGLKVTSSSFNSDLPGEADSVHLTFSQPVALSSFTRAAVTLIGPDGAHAIRKVVPANTQDSARQRDTTVTQFDVLFGPLTVAGNYTVTVAANVSDIYGNLMDEDDNLVPGESSDAYTATLVVAGPRVTGATAGTERPVSHAIVTFDRPMDLSSFSTNSFALTGPGGNPIAITGVSAVPHTGDFQIEVDFAPSSAVGRYTLTVHAGVADIYGNVLTADAATNFQVNYTAAATDFQDIEIFGQAGTQTLHFGSATGPVTADDAFGTISLGSNSFTFYGQTYSQLFVSSNGVITFGGGTSAIVPVGDSRFNPSLAYIAVYWTDLFKSGTEPMIVWRIDGNQLIIEWYRVTIFDGSPAMTFQAILQLNTGAAAGDIVLNYSSVTGTGDQPEDVGVTVGVKDAGTASDVARLLVEDGTHFSSTGSPLVQTGKAVRITAS